MSFQPGDIVKFNRTFSAQDVFLGDKAIVASKEGSPDCHMVVMQKNGKEVHTNKRYIELVSHAVVELI